MLLVQMRQIYHNRTNKPKKTPTIFNGEQYKIVKKYVYGGLDVALRKNAEFKSIEAEGHAFGNTRPVRDCSVV